MSKDIQWPLITVDHIFVEEDFLIGSSNISIREMLSSSITCKNEERTSIDRPDNLVEKKFKLKSP